MYAYIYVCIYIYIYIYTCIGVHLHGAQPQREMVFPTHSNAHS